MLKNKTYFNWSTGKDSALALYYLLKDEKYSVDFLLTSVNKHYNRVSMHGLRTELLHKQVAEIGIPNGIIELPEFPSNEVYEQLMMEKVQQLKAEKFECAAFGDIFLADLRKYREDRLNPFKIKTIFPLWKKNTKTLMREFIDKGFKAITVCVNATLLDESFVGRSVDEDFLKDLPKHIDPCGENGEFHTFCYDAPFFKNPVSFSVGEKVLKTYNNADYSRFWFCDLLPNINHGLERKSKTE